jgi:hypothetical protein
VSVAQFEQVLDAVAERSDVRISFDDGNASDVEVALHIGGDSETKPMFASLLTVNRVVLFRRRHNRVHSAAYFAAVAVGEGIRAAAGRPTSRASIVALLQPSRRVRALAT